MIFVRSRVDSVLDPDKHGLPGNFAFPCPTQTISMLMNLSQTG
jgi:hypothetical protein